MSQRFQTAQSRSKSSPGGQSSGVLSGLSTFPDYYSYTVSKLKEELKRRGLPVSGVKQLLISRLEASDQQTLKENGMNQDSHSLQNGPSQENNETFEVVSGEDQMDNAYKQLVGEMEQFSPEALKRQKQLDRERRQGIVLWKRPLVTLQYFFLELLIILQKEKRNILKHKKTCSSIAFLTLFVSAVYFIEGSHQQYFVVAKKLLFWCGYWVGLGVLSSVGLGTGLHTFLLYLGPHIAQVTLAAWECNSLDFPEPPYPDDTNPVPKVFRFHWSKRVLCPLDNHHSQVNMWTIMSKVRLEAVMWGAGTAIGELPPYFMARAARQSGTDADDEDIEKLEELISSESKDLFTRAKRFIPQLVERVGFFGILACASIPNPLFDLAGITCGHCLVPFWTFFGATLIGKAIIKMHIQQTFVILCFSKTYVQFVLTLLGKIPVVGKYILTPFERAVQVQIEKLHRDPSKAPPKTGTNILGWVFEKLVTIMIVYFLLSIVNSLAQSYCKRLDERKRQMSSMKDDKKE